MKRMIAGVCLAAGLVAPAFAEEKCGATVTQRYGETRATFQDVWAGCTAAKECQLSASKIDKTNTATGISHELRITLKPGATQLGLQLTDVFTGMQIDKATQLTHGKVLWALTGQLELRDNTSNVYHVKDAAKADEVARELVAKAREVRWTYVDKDGATQNADFPMRGSSKALEWVTCMTKPAQ